MVRCSVTVRAVNKVIRTDF